jgi:hypothetical protein
VLRLFDEAAHRFANLAARSDLHFLHHLLNPLDLN